MRKLALLTLLTVAVNSFSTFAADDKTKGKKQEKCTMSGSCCKKGASKAAMLKASAKPAKATLKSA